jgi:inorganic pyrophosphatase
MSTPPDLRRLPAFAVGERRAVNVVIETARGSRNKFAWDDDARLFRLRKVLPEGMAFPYDFGFVPSTLAEDGDPLDVLVLMDEPAFAGCLITCRIVGAIVGDEGEPGRPRRRVRNDRLMAVALASRTHEDLRSLADVNESKLGQIEAFFVQYQQTLGKRYRVRGRKGPREAWRLVDRAARSWRASPTARGG